MRNGGVRRLQFFMLAIAVFAFSASANACNVVYGSDWAFVIEGPADWAIACGKDSLDGTSVTFWPAATSPSEAKSLLYVSVSKKLPSPLIEFVRDEQRRFSAQQESLNTTELDLSQFKLKQNTMAFQLAPAQPARQELIAYIDGPTAYFILVLTSASAEELERQRPVFFFCRRVVCRDGA